jgi:hypothetical protein
MIRFGSYDMSDSTTDKGDFYPLKLGFGWFWYYPNIEAIKKRNKYRARVDLPKITLIKTDLTIYLYILNKAYYIEIQTGKVEIHE